METSGNKVIDKKGLMLLMYLGFYWVYDGMIVALKSSLSRMNKANKFNSSKSLEWFYCFSIILADAFIIIFQLFLKKKSDKKILFLSPNEFKKDYKKYLLLFVSSSLEFLIRISDLVYMIVLVRRIYPIGMIFLFSFYIIFRYLFFMFAAFKEKKKLYTFTVISMCIICPCAFFFFFLNKRYCDDDYSQYIALTLLKLIMVPLRDIINDYLMSKRQVEPSDIMSFRGFVNLIFMIIFTLFTFPFHLIEFVAFFNDGLSFWMIAKITLFLAIIIFSMIKYYNLLVTIKKYTSFTAVFSYLLLYIVKYIEYRKDSEEVFHLNNEDMANIFYISFAVFLILVYSKIIKNRFNEEDGRDIEMKDYAIEETNPSTEDSYSEDNNAQTKIKEKDNQNIFNFD